VTTVVTTTVTAIVTTAGTIVTTAVAARFRLRVESGGGDLDPSHLIALLDLEMSGANEG
jgi:hypothetical protein